MGIPRTNTALENELAPATLKRRVLLKNGVEVNRSTDGRYEVHGELNYASVSDVYKETAPLFRQESDLAIDLSGVTHSDSAGVALLVEWLSEARERNQPIHFFNVPEQMLEVVRISSLDRVLPISS